MKTRILKIKINIQGDFKNFKYNKITKKLHAVLNCLLKVIRGRESKKKANPP